MGITLAGTGIQSQTQVLKMCQKILFDNNFLFLRKSDYILNVGVFKNLLLLNFHENIIVPTLLYFRGGEVAR